MLSTELVDVFTELDREVLLLKSYGSSYIGLVEYIRLIEMYFACCAPSHSIFVKAK